MIPVRGEERQGILIGPSMAPDFRVLKVGQTSLGHQIELRGFTTAVSVFW